MPVIAFADALPNGAAMGTRVSAFACVSLLAMLPNIAPCFGDTFTGWCVSFLTSEL
jgi:hypothetical protein